MYAYLPSTILSSLIYMHSFHLSYVCKCTLCLIRKMRILLYVYLSNMFEDQRSLNLLISSIIKLSKGTINSKAYVEYNMFYLFLPMDALTYIHLSFLSLFSLLIVPPSLYPISTNDSTLVTNI